MELISLSIALLLLFLIYALTVRYQRRRQERMRPPVSSDIVNTTNYHLDSGQVEAGSELDREEAGAVVENWRRGEQIPAPRDFYRVKKGWRSDG